MSIRSITGQVRTPLLLMAGLEIAIPFSSVYVAGLIVLGNFSDCLRLIAPIAAIVLAVAVLSLTAMGLYQFHQRRKFSEAVVRRCVSD